MTLKRDRIRSIAEKLPGWLLTILTVLCILWLTLASEPVGDTDIPLFPGADKLAHSIMFGGLTAVAIFDWTRVRSWRTVPAGLIVLIALLSVAFGIGIEFTQRSMNLGRGFEVSDMLADAAGAFVVAVAAMLYYRHKEENAIHKTTESQQPVTEDEGTGDSETNGEEPQQEEGKPSQKKKHKGLRIAGKILGALIIFILLIPVMIYIPPVQTLLKNVACNVVRSSTGMDVSIDKFRLKFPLDVSLQGVSVVEAGGDTMVNAREVIADVKLLPLLRLDVKVNRLLLNDGYYRMVSADSSMIMTIRAGYLDVDSRSSVNIARSEILLNKVLMRDGDVKLYMDVWKKKPTPADTSSVPFLIRANDLRVENIKFAMSMLPTIDTLSVATDKLNISNAIINLRTNEITASNLDLGTGSFTYLAPTPEYIKAHPAPVDTISEPSAPMRISARRIALANFGGLYGIKGAKPMPGFDPNYISVSNVGIVMHDFYNEATTIRLPIDSIRATERCGLRITEGRGTFRMDSTGMDLSGLDINTLYSHVALDATIPFALMELKPEAKVDVAADARVGFTDIAAFMPSLNDYLRYLPKSGPLKATLKAKGTLASVDIPLLNASIPGIFRLSAKGNARNPLNFKKLMAHVDIDGEVSNPSPIDKIAGPIGFELPPFRLKGTAGVNRSTYEADLALTTPLGNVAAKGRVSMSAESYNADLSVDNLNVAHFVPKAGIGNVTATLKADGAGFNPTLPHARTHINAGIAEIVYNKKPLRDISADVTLGEGDYAITAFSPNPDIDFELKLNGNVAPDLYSAKGYVYLYNADLQTLGLSPTLSRGGAIMEIDGTASPAKWLYDVDMQVSKLEWDLPDSHISLPEGVAARLLATDHNVECTVNSDLTSIDFSSSCGLQKLVDSFMSAANEATAQISHKELIMDSIQNKLPPFKLNMAASGRGLVRQFLQPSGMGLDTICATLSNDSLLRGNIAATKFNSGTMNIDTLTLNLNQRGSVLDYKIHMGNRPGTFDEFAKVDLNGYIGSNRISAFLRQRNIKGEMGYRLGFTAAMNDSDITLHFTPLRATIAYLPWTLNNDNHISVNIPKRRIEANLAAQSKESSIIVMTEDNPDGGVDFLLKLGNIHLQDFLAMSTTAPPVKATVNSDIRLHYDGKSINGNGSLGITDMFYDKLRVGDFDLTLDAGVDPQGDTRMDLGLTVDNSRDAAVLHAILGPDEQKEFAAKELNLVLNRFPLSVANAFLGTQTARLSGVMNGDMAMTGKFTDPKLNGSVNFEDVNVFIPFIGSSLRFDTVPVTVKDNLLQFDRFDVWGANSNPLTLDGTVDASNLANIGLDLGLKANNFQVMKSDKRSKADLYGKLFMNIDASARGPMSHFDVNATVSILGTSDIYYNLPTEAAAATVGTTDANLVKFVNFTDSTLNQKQDSIANTVAMRIRAKLNINPGTQVTVNLSGNGTDKVQINPSGELSYYQNYMGDMTLNGQLNTGSGTARYNVPVMGEKSFEINPASYVVWSGDIMNPALHLDLSDKLKASVTQSGGNSRLVNFLVGISATGTLSSPKVVFDLSTDDDLSLQNELESMSADQRSQQAMNLLITGMYTGVGMKSNAGPITGNVYNFLASQINSWAAKNIRGVDLSFGVDQYDQTNNGQKSTTTSYSYQVSKSLFNNRFKINVGGNYSTDDNADENIAENLISDVSFEYMLKQTQSTSMLVKLFRHTGFESVLEGEVTEMGVGFVMKRKINNLGQFFRFWRRKKKKQQAPADTIVVNTGETSTEKVSKAKKGGKK